MRGQGARLHRGSRHRTEYFARGNFASQGADAARNQKHNDGKRNENLDHAERFCPSGEERRVCRTEGGTLRKRDKKIIDKVRTPSFAFESAAFASLELHLREKKTATAEGLALPTFRRSAAIKAPIPKRENQHIR